MKNDMTKSEQLERDAERIRAHLAETAIELRARLTPRHAIDQLFDLSPDSAALKILRNLRDKTVANPVAVGIIGAGMAWLMYSGGREARRPNEAPNLAQRRTFSGDESKRAENSLSDQPSIVPSGMEEENRGHGASACREPTGPPGGHD
jgi:hypothetical protein